MTPRMLFERSDSEASGVHMCVFGYARGLSCQCAENSDQLFKLRQSGDLGAESILSLPETNDQLFR